ncbi:Gfo/Idh/MocA family oxidoreductase [Streptomyces caniscabiei]|uniref:Gfo/Idh/MocA family protein n=1 Tax=Streptomyces caniscabiei TaxID=2746961 RepID=UPI0029ADAF64|nr:Gfo/Idh/MocA family oxidoreductase [Streptomyces caniscabiei]MDX2604900.1 Gfo/Idh/MocA family oxidoreductase [Streptomyces caniscabiei]MDX2733934.1 Gfo/Idh/MocA family oxidoreductase [Streptomyces caniscabiei]MDX2778190.1 Gfo/Idh/MocA family oxidoreductase [Streptomyces caniscabiei]
MKRSSGTAEQGSLGVAVVGTGRMGADHARRISEVISGAHVAAVVDVDTDRARAVAAGIAGCAAFDDPAEALAAPGVDAVLVASPGPAHEAALLAAFAHDLPVLCEKPLTPDTASALRLLEAEQRLGRRRVQVGFMRRYDREYVKLKALLDSGDLGRPLLLHHRHRNAAPPPGFTDAMAVNDSVAHEMDITRWLLGQEITAVTVLRPRPSGHAPAGLSDPQLVVFETDGGAVVDVEIFLSARYGYQVQAEAVCEDGTARIGDGHDMLVNTAGRWGGTVTPSYLERFEDAYDRQVQAWVDATRRGEVTGPSTWDGYAVAAISEAGVSAQTEGVRVEVELAARPALYR